MPLFASAPMLMPASPSPLESVFIGTLVKYTALSAGTIAHMHAIMRQLAVPNSAKNAVDTSTTNTCPQQ